jgi:hypothetical protein
MRRNPEFNYDPLWAGKRQELEVAEPEKTDVNLAGVVRMYGGDKTTIDDLRMMGVETIADLKYLTPEDLASIGLKLPQARKMLDKYGNGGYIPTQRIVIVTKTDTAIEPKEIVFQKTNSFEEAMVGRNVAEAGEQATQQAYAEQEALHRAEADGFAAPVHRSYSGEDDDADDGRENCW